MIRLQLTRIQEAADEEPERWLVRAWKDGHGCDAVITEWKPPYTTTHEVSADGLRQRLQIHDWATKIAETVWPV